MTVWLETFDWNLSKYLLQIWTQKVRLRFQLSRFPSTLHPHSTASWGVAQCSRVVVALLWGGINSDRFGSLVVCAFLDTKLNHNQKRKLLIILNIIIIWVNYKKFDAGILVHQLCIKEKIIWFVIRRRIAF